MAELTITSPGTNPYVLNTQGEGYVEGESVPIEVRHSIQYVGKVSISLDLEYSDSDFPAFTPYLSRSYTAGGETVNEYDTAWKANYGASPRSASLHFIPIWTGTGNNPFSPNGVTQEIYQDGYESGVSVTPSISTKNVGSSGGSFQMSVNYSPSDADITVLTPSWCSIANSSSLVSGSVRVVNYTINYLANTGGSRGAAIRFEAAKGNVSASATTFVSQEAGTTPVGVTGSVSVSPSERSVVSQSVSSTVYVTYVSASSGGYSIKSPSLSNVVNTSILGSSSVGESKIVTYSLSYPANTSTNPVTRSATFLMSRSGDIKTATTYVYQAAAPAPVQGNVTTDPASPVTVGSQSTGSFVYVNYVSASAGGYNIKVPSLSTDLDYYVRGTNTRGDITQVTYSLSYPANTSTSPVTHSVTFAMSRSVSGIGDIPTANFKIHQAAAEAPVILPTGSVLIPDSPYTVGSGDQYKWVQVIYSESVGRYSIDTPVYGGGVSSVTEVDRQTSGNNTVVNWFVNFPANTTTSSVTRWVTFQMTSGSHVPSKQAYIYQPGRVVGGVIVGPYNPQNVASSTTSSTFFVTYSSANSGGYAIKNPITSSGITNLTKSTQSVGNNVYGTYTISYPTNSSTANPVTHSVTFVMSSSDSIESNTGYIYQAKANPNYTIYCTASVSKDSNAFQSRYWVRYSGVLYLEDTTDPVWTGNITDVVYRSQVRGVNSVTVAYDVTASANLNTSPAYSQITWGIANSGVTAVTTITQSAASVPTGDPYIEVVGNPLSAESGDWSKTFQVIYHNATDWTIDQPGTGGGTQAVNVIYNTTSGSNKIYTYDASFQANADYEAKTRLVFLQMHSGSEYRYATAQIVQAGKQGTGRIILRPEYARVASFSTESVFQVTASRNGVNYDSLQLTGSTNVVVETIGGGYLDLDDTYYYTYRVKYPQNNSSSPVTRSVTVRMVSESLVALQTYFVYQDPDTEGGTGTGISISPSSTTITPDSTYASCVAYYYGVSDFSQISTPTTSTSGWVASVGQVQQSNGLTVVTWNFNGTINTGASNRTINFTIGATGLSSKTFSILQLGTGGGGGGTATGFTVPIWKRNVISGSTSGATLTVNSGSTVIFQDRIYAEPGSNIPQVDLNRICEPYVAFDPVFPETYALENGTYQTPGAAGGRNLPVFSASFESGERYQGKIARDWSYEQDLKQSLLIYSPTVQEAAAGQYLVCTIWGGGGNTVGFQEAGGQSWNYGTSTDYYRDLYRTGSCGSNYSVLTADYQMKSWTVKKNSNWVVYFRNRYNGLESLVLDGTVVPSINVTRNNYLQGVYRYTKSYLNGVIDRWKCNTGILSDDLSPLVSEMASAPEVVLHDIKNDKLYRTRANTNTVQKKTFWNQGRKFATYEFELESILNQTRR